MNILIWNENRHERRDFVARRIYPNGIHGVLSDCLRAAGHVVITATLDEPNHGLSEEKLAETDVFIWWGNLAHAEVDEQIVDMVNRHVLAGMGLIVLHSGYFSSVFKKLIGTSCRLNCNGTESSEKIWNVNPSHPITRGVGQFFDLAEEEVYGEHFDVPEPDELIFLSWFKSGEVFRSGMTFYRGKGKIFYFRPGHETYPTYHNKYVQKVIKNAVNWARPIHSSVNQDIELDQIEMIYEKESFI
ncbi:Trehalose utilization protein [Amphibacillus marinus]|uniref:Trehalose utilization protein n=1 Tax=Amphibacillus marinus TaxID=872970 RepID=A0A1H8L740_9BACI|nr:ThuA domain-containing protein [Amphibacillus marinus]SEO00915.1 Trehalose utilization protein [Amphibacillus marinus]